MLCWIEGGAGFFIFSVLLGGAVELPGRSRPAPGVVTFAGGQCRALSPDFPAAALAVFIPWRGAGRFDRARDGTRADGVWDRGRRRLFLFRDIPWRATGSSRSARGRRRRCLCLRRALSPTFRAGEMVFFIPWRVVAEDSGAAQLDLLGPPGWCSGCWPHDGDVDGGASISTLVIFRFGADDGARAIGATDDAAAAELPGRRRRQP